MRCPSLASILSLAVFMLGSAAMTHGASAAPASGAPPIIIAHRGASAERPEHTLEAYRLAIAQGADYIEPDLVPTRDGVLVARHENEIGSTTDVAERSEFANRRTTRLIDGAEVEGWFTEDFTLAELKSLHARERLPMLRPANTAHDGRYKIPTFEEVIALAKSEGARLGRVIGIYPETKHPTYFRSIGLPLEEKLLETLAAHGLDSAKAPVFIQSFEAGNLAELAKRTKVRLIQLMAAEGGPADRPELNYATMATPAGLAAIAGYAHGIGVEKAMLIPRAADGRLQDPTPLVADAHSAGLAVHVWTFRPENYFLPQGFKGAGGPAGKGDAEGEIRAFLETGIDGLFSDSVPPARAAVDAMVGSGRVGIGSSARDAR